MICSLPHYSVRALVNYLVNCGLDRKLLLTHIATDEQALSNAQQSYPQSDYEALLSYGANQLNIPNIGFMHGKAFELSFWGILGHIVAAAPTLWDALGYQKRYQCLLGNSGQAYHEIEDEVVTIRWLSDAQCSANSIEQVITAWVAFAFSYTLSNDKPISVHFTHSAVSGLEQYQEFFGCEVLFNTEFNGIKVKQSSLTLPLTAFNEEVLTVLCNYAEQKLSQKKSTGSLDIIRQYIIETLPEGIAELNEVAQFLGISSRQLQRKFQQQNTSLTAFLEHIRQDLAVSYLTQTNHKLLYISSVLGYSEQSAFQRAFKRWFNCTPQEYRLNPKAITRDYQ
ncbi:AraC family transcriptional regulator [Thalassotalea sp. M1531]|uniref:AraC family transcriptional regulator n=1 Tax=Thalassotalea algicola TaxID=2716224 RepID=A0A7Y0L914_9GAMM|nr:AraC family transcriptional regulator [Thalassotalea algicola]NMP30180.1 AraC family transcriptional regulator [Thalassotalea algicola]